MRTFQTRWSKVNKLVHSYFAVKTIDKPRLFISIRNKKYNRKKEVDYTASFRQILTIMTFIGSPR